MAIKKSEKYKVYTVDILRGDTGRSREVDSFWFHKDEAEAHVKALTAFNRANEALVFEVAGHDINGRGPND